MQYRTMIVVGGVSLVVGALAFVGVFGYLAANFNYPDILDGTAAEVLPRLREGGASTRAVWAVYAFLPLFLIPGALGAYFAFQASRPRMTLALVAVCLAALSMCLGLMRWPSIHWALAEAYPATAAATGGGVDAVFAGLNLYLGNYIGEFLGESMLSLFFGLTGVSMLGEARPAKWLGWSGVGFAVLFFVGAFRNVTGSVQIVADINNGLLPLWMIVLGVAMVRYSKLPDTSPDSPSS
jgi:hypothetical protein